MSFEIWPQIEIWLQTKFFFELFLSLTDHFELWYVKIGRICDF